MSVPKFCLTTHTCSALVRTLRAQADLIDELIEKDMYDFVMVGRLQSDPLERRFSQYRQMSGSRFLVSLREVISSEKILKCRALLKNEIDIDEDVLQVEDLSRLADLLKDLEKEKQSIVEATLEDSSEEVATYVAG